MVMSPISTSYGCSMAKAIAIRPDIDARDVILLIGYLTRLEQGEWDTRARHLLEVILDGLRSRDPDQRRLR
jgi:hypothetical protein